MKKEDFISRQPLVSIVIPSYNHAKWIGNAIDSVLNQTYKNFEVLIIDNNSTDVTDEVIAQFQDSRIRVFKINNYGSIAFSRNTALNFARGEWVAFLDSDDWWKPEKLSECSKYFNLDTTLIYHHLVKFSEFEIDQGSRVIKSRKLKAPIFFDLLINGNTIATSSVVVRKEALLAVQGMRENKEMIGVEDFNTWLRIARVSDGFKLVKQYLGFYRQHSHNVSLNSNEELTYEATKEFLDILTLKQMGLRKSKLIYSNARGKFLKKDYSGLVREFATILVIGRFGLKLKSLFMICVVLIKKIAN